MEKSLGNKRNKIGDPSDEESEPDQIGEITRIFGNFQDGETRTFTEEDPVTHQPIQRQRVVSKIFDNEDFGFHKITVERPLRLNFQASAERIARLEDESGFKNLATSTKKDRERPPARRSRPASSGRRKSASCSAPSAKPPRDKLFKDRKDVPHRPARDSTAQRGVRLSAPELKAVLAALGERDETAEICRDRDGNPEPDAELRDTETVPLKESIEAYFKREVLPHVPDAWIDHTKTKVGYEIPLNRHFYRYEPPRPLEVIETDIKSLEDDILDAAQGGDGVSALVQPQRGCVLKAQVARGTRAYPGIERRSQPSSTPTGLRPRVDDAARRGDATPLGLGKSLAAGAAQDLRARPVRLLRRTPRAHPRHPLLRAAVLPEVPTSTRPAWITPRRGADASVLRHGAEQAGWGISRD